MEIYLIRHTTPSIGKNICYGQSDIGVHSSFKVESKIIKQYLPQQIDVVYCSPLQRCSILANYLFSDHKIQYDHSLKEMNFGHWEMQAWDNIDQEYLRKWMDDFVNISVPGGENYEKLFQRSIKVWQNITLKNKQAVVITHAGVIRSILSYITKIPLEQSFNMFTISYGCVIKIEDSGFEFLHKKI